MTELKPLSRQTRHNWEIDAVLFISAIIAVLSGIYFLIVPGGYQGGRNPLYNLVILFDRHGWDLVHTWTGAAMIAAAVVHIAIHWKWIKSMIARVRRSLLGKSSAMNGMGRFNVAVDALIGLSFLLAAVSGIYFLYFPDNHAVTDPMILFSRGTWDLLHNWSGVVMTISALTHFAIHWKWVVKVTRRYLQAGTRNKSILPAPSVQVQAAAKQ